MFHAKSSFLRSAGCAAILVACGAAFSVQAADAATGFGSSGTMKLRVPAEKLDEVLRSSRGAKTVATYDSFAVVEVAADAIPTLAEAELLTDENMVLLNTGALDTTDAGIKALQQLRGEFKGKAMHMVQFASAVKPEWLTDLTASGVEVVTYIPSNAYIVYGTSQQIAAMQDWAAKDSHIQWNGEYLADYKIQPGARTIMNDPAAAGADDVLFVVQLVKDEATNKDTLGVLDVIRKGDVINEYDILNYHNIVIAMPPAMVPTVAALADVVSIDYYVMPQMHDERQDQIIAGNLSGNVPSGPGYLNWLAGKGFTQAQFSTSGFAVDISDSGLDNGTTSPNHFGLYVTGVKPGTSRVVYNRLVGSAHTGSTLKGCDGHGTLNSHIVMGYNDIPGSPHADTSGYHYGLGVCPFVKIGSSVIFDPSTFTSPNYTTLQSQAYNNGARISTNSWGAATAGAYNADSQAYDTLVRDAQPTGATFPAAGNQEMVIVFSAGNSGSGATTIGSPGSGKNIICVGAGEGVQAFGVADGCAIADSGADNANDMATFSSRGPCSDGRKKPDIVAPGTHISGGVTQQASPGVTGLADTCFNGAGVCGGSASSHFFPLAGQQWWSASSGTSHSCPAVAGGAALVRQYFINQGMTAPSPAMTKAVLMNSARYMNGTGAGGALPSNSQGMGEMNLGELFTRTTTNSIFKDELPGDMFTATGQSRTYSGTIGDTTKPFRVTLAWTDAPGATSGAAYKNNLDLTVTVGGNTYKGNVFGTSASATGGAADTQNNVESVFLPAGTSGNFTVTITATNISSDGVPGNASALDQDYALVVYNYATCVGATVSSSPASRTLCRGTSTTFTVGFTGSPTPTFQWRKGGTSIGGAVGSSYTITSTQVADNGSYDCVVTNTCGSASSVPAMLTVCIADYNCDAAVDFFDYLDFVNDFTAGATFADVNGDSSLDFFDYLDFVDAFTAGC